MGADFIEPDLVSTADGVLVARHEPEIGGTTDIADHPEFADRHTTKIIDGQPAPAGSSRTSRSPSCSTLRAVERLPLLRQRNTHLRRHFPVPTFDEILALRERLSAELGREIGVYPETKHPTYFASIGLAAGARRWSTRSSGPGSNRPDAPVFVQSFETATCAQLRGGAAGAAGPAARGRGRAGRLVPAGDPRGYADLVTPAGLAEIAGYADAIGPDKDQVIARDADGALDRADRAGRRRRTRRGCWCTPTRSATRTSSCRPTCAPGPAGGDYGDSFAEYAAFFAAGVDGVFTDNTDTAFVARAAHANGTGG